MICTYAIVQIGFQSIQIVSCDFPILDEYFGGELAPKSVQIVLVVLRNLKARFKGCAEQSLSKILYVPSADSNRDIRRPLYNYRIRIGTWRSDTKCPTCRRETETIEVRNILWTRGASLESELGLDVAPH